MNILIALSYYYPNISGLSIYAKTLAEELYKRGNKITVLTSRHVKKYKYFSKENGIGVKRLWTPFILGRGPLMPTYFLEAFIECYKADVVNIHTPQFEGFFLAIISKILRKKLVLTHHCDLSNWPGFLNVISEKIIYFSLLISGALADSIIVYTKDYANHSKFLQHFGNKLIFLLPPVKFKISEKKLEIIDSSVKYKIGFAGRIAREKGIDYLINSTPYLNRRLGKDFKIYFAGPRKGVIGGGFESQLSDLIEKYKNYLVFTGPLDQVKMAMFYRSIDVLVLPSVERLESFGFVQVESMFSGCPVVASDLPGVRVPIRFSKMGEIVNIKNSEDIADKIVKILKNKNRYIRNTKDLLKIFNWEKTISSYEKLFKK